METSGTVNTNPEASGWDPSNRMHDADRAARIAKFAADAPVHAEALRIGVEAGMERAWDLLEYVGDSYASDMAGTANDVRPRIEALPGVAFGADDIDLAVELRDVLAAAA